MRSYSKEKYRLNGIGQRFGKWEQIGPTFRTDRPTRVAVMRCHGCDELSVVGMANANCGRTTQCQKCANKFNRKNGGKTTHGMSRTSEYRIYQRMIERCHNPNHSHFQDYGGRGIRVCDEWRIRGGFTAFYAHLGQRPSLGHQLDRIDNDGNYEPGNVKWSTRVENNRNKRSNSLLTINGVTKCVTEWSHEPGASPRFQIYGRIQRGWNHEEAVFGKGVTCGSF